MGSLEALPSETYSQNGVRLIEVLVSPEQNVKIRKSFQNAH
jgi:hypothetical protein